MLRRNRADRPPPRARRANRIKESIMMKLRWLPLLAVPLVLGILTSIQAEEKKGPRTLGTIERLDPEFDKLIAKDTALEVLSDGYKWVEGPVWVRGNKGGGYVLFSDIPNNSVF